MKDEIDWNTAEVFGGKNWEEYMMLVGLNITQEEMDEIKKFYDKDCDDASLFMSMRFAHHELGVLDIDIFPPAIYDVKKLSSLDIKKGEKVAPRIKFITKRIK